MAIGNRNIPYTSYSSLMYGTGGGYSIGGSGATTSTAPRTWIALPSRYSSSNVQSSTNSQTKDNDDRTSSSENAGGISVAYDGWSNPYSDSWTRENLANWGLGQAKGVGLNAAAGYAAGLSLGDALSFGLGAGLSPAGFFGGIGDLVAGGIGIKSNGLANTLGTIAGTALAGPIGGFFGRAAAPFANDLVRDALNIRDYEVVRDLAEDLSPGFATGRTVGSAFAQNYDALSGYEDSLGIANRALAAAYDAVNFGAKPGTFDENAVTALARTQLEQQGYVGWEAQALLNEALPADVAVQEAIALATALDEDSYRPTSVQKAASSMSDTQAATDRQRAALEATSRAVEAANNAVSSARAAAQAASTATDSVSNSAVSSSNDRSSSGVSTGGGFSGGNTDAKNSNKNTNDGNNGGSGGNGNGSGGKDTSNSGSNSGSKDSNKNSSGDKNKGGSSSGDRSSSGSSSGGSSSSGGKSKGGK